MVRLWPGCVLSHYHWVWGGDAWCCAGRYAVTPHREGNADFVRVEVDCMHDIKLDGHEDTVRVDGLLCATVGMLRHRSRYVYTSVHCLQAECVLCDAVYKPTLLVPCRDPLRADCSYQAAPLADCRTAPSERKLQAASVFFVFIDLRAAVQLVLRAQ